MDNKGSMSDLPFIIVVLFILGISVFVTVKFLGAYDDAWTYGGVGQEIIDQGKSAMYTFDYMFVFLAIGLSATTLIGAFMIRSHPIFYVFSTILLGIMVLVSGQITNAFDKFVTSSAFSSIANSFPMMVTFMRNLPLFILISGILIAAVMYGRPQGGGRV